MYKFLSIIFLIASVVFGFMAIVSLFYSLWALIFYAVMAFICVWLWANFSLHGKTVTVHEDEHGNRKVRFSDEDNSIVGKSIARLEAKNGRDKVAHIRKAYNDHINRKITYRDNEVLNLSFQCCETIDIIENSKNLDTIVSRLDFLDKVISQLSELCLANQKRYNRTSRVGIANYEKAYKIKASQKIVTTVTDPFSMDVFELRDESRYKWFLRHLENQESEIQYLKSKSAIRKRYVKMLGTLDDIVGSQHTSYLDKYDVDIDGLKTLIKRREALYN